MIEGCIDRFIHNDPGCGKGNPVGETLGSTWFDTSNGNAIQDPWSQFQCNRIVGMYLDNTVWTIVYWFGLVARIIVYPKVDSVSNQEFMVNTGSVGPKEATVNLCLHLL